ncbi:hypothetical protein Nmel_003730 [Mimus melanotis]
MEQETLQKRKDVRPYIDLCAPELTVTFNPQSYGAVGLCTLWGLLPLSGLFVLLFEGLKLLVTFFFSQITRPSKKAEGKQGETTW